MNNLIINISTRYDIGIHKIRFKMSNINIPASAKMMNITFFDKDSKIISSSKLCCSDINLLYPTDTHRMSVIYFNVDNAIISICEFYYYNCNKYPWRSINDIFTSCNDKSCQHCYNFDIFSFFET